MTASPGVGPWQRLAEGADVAAAEEAGRLAGRSRFPTARDLELGIERLQASAHADLRRLAAGLGEEESRLRTQAIRAESELRRAGNPGPGVAIADSGSATEEPPGQAARRRRHLAALVLVLVLAGLEAALNVTTFQVLGLSLTETRLVTLGAQLLLTYAAHKLGTTLGRLIRRAAPQRISVGHAVLGSVIAGSLAGVIYFLTVVRGDVVSVVGLGIGVGNLDLVSGQVEGLFASLTVLLVAVAMELGFTSESTAPEGAPERTGSFRRRRARRRAARFECRRSADAVAREELSELLAGNQHRIHARHDEWVAAMAAFILCFRSECPVELLLDLDRIGVPNIGLPDGMGPAMASDEEGARNASGLSPAAGART